MIRTLLILIVVTAGTSSVPWLSSAPAPDIAMLAFDEGKDESDNGGDDDEGDDDREDEKSEREGRGNRGRVEAAAPYEVDVDCDHDADDDQTTCTFEGQAPEGAKDVGHVDLPENELCSAVIETDAEYVDPDPNTRVVGYKSRGGEGRFTLVLEGEVTTGGTATYWFKTGDGVFPAKGPGLVCDGDQRSATMTPVVLQPTPLAGATETPAAPELTDTAGAILVQTYECPVDSAGPEYDWYGACAPGEAGRRFRLSQSGVDGISGKTAATDEQGQVRFGSLSPGLYELTAADGDWCRAQSDAVDVEGRLTVTAGERVTVWTFFCLAGSQD